MTTDHGGPAQVDDTIAAIDAATGCQHCAQPLGESPSDEFCSPQCQAQWHAARSVPLTSYREPVDLAAHYSNQVEGRSPETTPVGYGAGQPCNCGFCHYPRRVVITRLDSAGDPIAWHPGGIVMDQLQAGIQRTDALMDQLQAGIQRTDALMAIMMGNVARRRTSPSEGGPR